MENVRAAVLAAGRGVRMGGERPKTLIPVEQHEPLLYYILKGLAGAGVSDVMIVTGFKDDAITDYVTESFPESNVSYIRNARYASWGNFHSVRVALDQSPGKDVLVVNCDVVVHPDVYRRAAEAPGDLVLAVQHRDDLDDEDMKVSITDGRIAGVSKKIAANDGQGEYAGVSMIRPAAALPYCSYSSDLEWNGDTSIYYEDVYAAILDRVDARPADVGPNEYAEVDEPADMAGAARVIAGHPDAW